MPMPLKPARLTWFKIMLGLARRVDASKPRQNRRDDERRRRFLLPRAAVDQARHFDAAVGPNAKRRRENRTGAHVIVFVDAIVVEAIVVAAGMVAAMDCCYGYTDITSSTISL